MVATNSMNEWISEEEKTLVAKLRENVLNKLPSDFFLKSDDDQTAFLLRWLRARSLNLGKAENMLVNALLWRKEDHVETVFDFGADPYVLETCPWTFAGVDKQGRPVEVAPFYKWDFRKIAANNKLEEIDFFNVQYFETMLKEIEVQNAKRKPGQSPITQYTVVCDVNGFPYGQVFNFPVMSKWFRAAARYEAYYPEILHKCVVINCPYSFTVFFNMCKVFMDKKTVEKFVCYPTVAEWQKDMKTLLDPAILPPQYGGTRTEPLPPHPQLKFGKGKIANDTSSSDAESEQVQ